MGTSSYRIVHELADHQIDQLMQLYAREWWTETRERSEVVRMLTGTSLLVGLVDVREDRLIGFSRVLSDFVFKALVLDVIVDADHRDAGLGSLLMNTLLAHPKLAHVRHFELYCRPELEGFYATWGFTKNVGELLFLRRESPHF